MRYLLLTLTMLATSVANATESEATDKECQFAADILNLSSMGYNIDKATFLKALALGKQCGIYIEDVKSSK